jgi:hypothetical protein
MVWWRVRERCTVAALADAHRAIKRPKAKNERIALLQSTFRRMLSRGCCKNLLLLDDVCSGSRGPKL